MHACLFYYRLKLFHKRFKPRPLLLNNSQFGSPSKSSFSTLHNSKSEQNDTLNSDSDSIPPLPPPMPPHSQVFKGLHPPSRMIKLHNSKSEQNDTLNSDSDSIPPLPPPMPPHSQVFKGLHPPSRMIKLSNSFYESYPIQKSFDDYERIKFSTDSFYESHPLQKSFDDYERIKFSTDSFYESHPLQKSFDDYVVDKIPVIPNAENDLSIMEGFAISSPVHPAGFFPEFLPDFALDISSISNDSTPEFAPKSLLQNVVQSPVTLDADARPPPITGGVGTYAGLAINRGVPQHVPMFSSPQNSNIKIPNIPTTSKQRKKRGKIGHIVWGFC